ncbi:YdcF family protein [Afifella sp. YEN Y35]|uniref:YdcF family protein n=1 Tax=Afifella sp. YEN Y35 TaxID=3388337 RepID=UPI0039E00591
MFFIISKVAGFFLAPSNALVILTIFGVVVQMLWSFRVGAVVAAAGLVGILACGLGPVANWLILPLENRFEQPASDEPAPDGIIVLGGALSDRVSGERDAGLELTEAGDRILALLRLARTYPQARIVFTGGSSALTGGGRKTEGELVGEAIERFGLSPERVTIESNSRNTAENARFSKEIAKPRADETWWLVTSAFHMPRAVGVFRAAGFPVTAYPVDFRAAPDDWMRPFATVSDGLRRTDVAFREWVGLLAYYWTGRIDTLFPGP